MPDLSAVPQSGFGVGNLHFESADEALDFYQRRLVLPAGRRAELAALLDDRLVATDHGWSVGLEDRQMATLSWGDLA